MLFCSLLSVHAGIFDVSAQRPVVFPGHLDHWGKSRSTDTQQPTPEGSLPTWSLRKVLSTACRYQVGALTCTRGIVNGRPLHNRVVVVFVNDGLLPNRLAAVVVNGGLLIDNRCALRPVAGFLPDGAEFRLVTTRGP